MPTVEIDELEFKQNQALRETVNKMMANPKSRRLLEQATKTVDPDAKTPLLDTEAELHAPVRALEEKIAKLEADRAAEKAEAEKREKLDGIRSRMNEGFARLRQQGYQDEGIAGIQKLMEEKGILDVDDAVVLFEKAHPPPAPVMPRGSGAWNFMEEIGDGEKNLQELIKTKGEHNPLVDRMAFEALAEVRGQPLRR